MAGYFGTEAQQRLQAQAEANVGFIDVTPGACQNGRMMGCDDLDALGWEAIESVLERDRTCGFRLIPAERIEELASWLAKRDFRFDSWDIFLADKATALIACEVIAATGLPEGLVEMPRPGDPENSFTTSVQSLMAQAGVVPFSGSLLVGAFGPAITVVVGDRNGTIQATAHSYLPHNRYSRFQHYAWGGLVAVDPSMRGRGLGNAINARTIIAAFRDLGASHVYELVSASNVASRRMVEHCGLRHQPGLVCGIATPRESERFTR